MLLGISAGIGGPKFFDYGFGAAEFSRPLFHCRHPGGYVFVHLPTAAQVPDCQTDEVAEDNAAGVALGRLDLSLLEEGQICGDDLG
jgi:hypothetical protein